MSKIEETAKPLGFNVHKKNYKVMSSTLSDITLHKTWLNMQVSIPNMLHIFANQKSLQMKLQGDKQGRKGHLSVATEVQTWHAYIWCERFGLYLSELVYVGK